MSHVWRSLRLQLCTLAAVNGSGSAVCNQNPKARAHVSTRNCRSLFLLRMCSFACPAVASAACTCRYKVKVWRDEDQGLLKVVGQEESCSIEDVNEVGRLTAQHSTANHSTQAAPHACQQLKAPNAPFPPCLMRLHMPMPPSAWGALHAQYVDALRPLGPPPVSRSPDLLQYINPGLTRHLTHLLLGRTSGSTSPQRTASWAASPTTWSPLTAPASPPALQRPP
jgi:hypothetical protein